MAEYTADKIRNYLLEVTENKYPIISVSQQPLDFGKNICIGDIGKSKYNLYKQILMGVREIKTKYVALAEDDTLYSPEHFLYRPEDGVCSYNTNGWFAQPGIDYFWRPNEYKTKSGGHWGCISGTNTLLKDMENYFRLNPLTYGGDGSSGFLSKMVKRESKDPCVIFIHKVSMGYKQWKNHYRRYGYPTDENKCYKLEQFGTVKDLIYNYWR